MLTLPCSSGAKPGSLVEVGTSLTPFLEELVRGWDHEQGAQAVWLDDADGAGRVVAVVGWL
jgi:hypothetical protein